MIDFAGLVLTPCMANFARPIIIFPLASQPGVPPYEARGIWTRTNIDVPTEDGIGSSAVLTIGIKVADFEVPPKQGDTIDIPACGNLPALGVHLIDDDDPDGQGGSNLTLKKINQIFGET